MAAIAMIDQRSKDGPDFGTPAVHISVLRTFAKLRQAADS